MNSNFEKYDFLFPNRVYRIPCLHTAIEKCHDNGEHSIADIACYLKGFDFTDLPSSKIFSTRVGENKLDCLFICEVHLILNIPAIRKIKCTSIENDQTLSIEHSEGKEVYCMGCLKYYTRLIYYLCFKNFKRKEYVTLNEPEHVINHICLNLSYPNLSYKYFYNMYSYAAKSQIVLRWKKERNGYQELAKFGEAICKDKLINFFEDKEHEKCSCSSVYYKNI